MECKCSLNNNYEIISLCDLEEFNEKINEFKDKSWGPVKFSGILTIDENRAGIKNILEAHLHIKITSSEIIDSPKPIALNVEGLNLTGKMLSISGSLFQSIIYTSDGTSNSLNSIKFQDAFNSYIILPEDTDPLFEKYCVYPCIENLSLNVTSPKNVARNIDLFLFAHKIELPLNIINEFIFYDFPRREKKEVVRVSFDNTKRKLIASSTGNVYNSTNPGYVLRFELKDSKATITKAIGVVNQNGNGTDFAFKLNNKRFEVNDLLFVEYTVAQNVTLTNFPFGGIDHDMNFTPNRIFKITPNGIVPNMLPNVILVKSMDDRIVFTVSFDIFLKILLPHPPTNAVTNPNFAGQEYFKLVVKDSNSVEKYRAVIQGNKSGYDIFQSLANKPFVYGYIVELTYKDDQRTEITDKPYPTSSKQTLTGTTKSFRITESGLVDI